MQPDDVFASTEPRPHSGSSVARMGEILDQRFELERVAGAGGMGAVWSARDRQTSERVAVKILLKQNEQQVVRFEREARLLSQLQHPGIAQYVAHGITDDGRRYMAMEWLEGEDLAARLQRGPLGLDESRLLVERVAEALSAVHVRQIVHRDVKPANLFLAGGSIEHVKVLDFGIAREPDPVVLTAEGLVVGTPAYMSPEQAQGDPNIDWVRLFCDPAFAREKQPNFSATHRPEPRLRGPRSEREKRERFTGRRGGGEARFF